MKQTLEQSKTEKIFWEDNVRTKQLEYDLAKKFVKKMEFDLKDAKRIRNKLERELKFGKNQVVKLTTKIQQTPYIVRKWGKDHPG